MLACLEILSSFSFWDSGSSPCFGDQLLTAGTPDEQHWLDTLRGPVWELREGLGTRLEEWWGDGAAPATDDRTKAPEPTSKLEAERQDNCSKVPHPEPVKLHVWAQALPSSAVAETWSRNMCTSYAVLQICTHFLTWTNSLCGSRVQFLPKTR